jgi:hypothetical protein
MRLETAHCQRALSRLEAQDGRTHASAQSFGRAIELYRHMGMRFWVQRAEEESVRLD